MWINGRVIFIQRGKREVFCPLLPFNTHFTLTFYRSFFHFVKYHKFHPNCTNLSPYTFKIRGKKTKQEIKDIFFVYVFFSFKSLSIHLFPLLYFNAFPFLFIPSSSIQSEFQHAILLLFLIHFNFFLSFIVCTLSKISFSETYHILATQLTFWVNLLEF